MGTLAVALMASIMTTARIWTLHRKGLLGRRIDRWALTVVIWMFVGFSLVFGNDLLQVLALLCLLLEMQITTEHLAARVERMSHDGAQGAATKA